jgi:pyrroline-5-carboxylate reductase
MLELLVLGGGRMGSALVAGRLRAGSNPDSLGVVEKLPKLRAELGVRFEGVAVLEAPVPSEGAVLAVKPADVPDACAALAAAGCRRVLSVAAGVGTAQLDELLGPGCAVVRAMPNMPALLGAGASAIAPGRGATSDDLAWAEEILASVGVVVRVGEKYLDAVTGLSGSGPAYVFLLAEAMIEGGVLSGLDREVSRRLVAQTILGSGLMLAGTEESATDADGGHGTGGASPAALRDMITSPGGTTAAGLRKLEACGFRSAVVEAVAAATERSRELGRPTEDG